MSVVRIFFKYAFYVLSRLLEKQPVFSTPMTHDFRQDDRNVGVVWPACGSRVSTSNVLRTTRFACRGAGAPE